MKIDKKNGKSIITCQVIPTRGTWLEDNITITDVAQNSGGTTAISVVDTEDSTPDWVKAVEATMNNKF